MVIQNRAVPDGALYVMAQKLLKKNPSVLQAFSKQQFLVLMGLLI